MDNRDLIRQYVDTGLEISEYQFNKLSNNDKKTYMRKRIIANENGRYLSHWEFNFLDEENKTKTLVASINKKNDFISRIFNNSPDSFINHVFDLLFNYYKNHGIPDFTLNQFFNFLENDSYIISKIATPHYVGFLSASAISSIVTNHDMLNKDDFIKYILNDEKLRRKLVHKNYIYFVTYTTDERIIDRILTDDFISVHVEELLENFGKFKLKSYIANKIDDVDNRYRIKKEKENSGPKAGQDDYYNVPGIMHKNSRKYLDDLIDRMSDIEARDDYNTTD